jgi:hypothetical protein
MCQSFETLSGAMFMRSPKLAEVPRHIAYFNLPTAVVDITDGSCAFTRLSWLCPRMQLLPHACNPASGWERRNLTRHRLSAAELLAVAPPVVSEAGHCHTAGAKAKRCGVSATYHLKPSNYHIGGTETACSGPAMPPSTK